MALSGTIDQYWGPSSHYLYEIDWSATQNISANQSTITAQMWLWADSGWSIYASATKYGDIKFNGTNYGISQAGVNTAGGSWMKLGASQSWTITHNSDGTASFTLGGDFAMNVTINGTYYGDITLPTTTFYLDTIPRATTLSSPNPPNWTAGNNVTFNLTRNSSSFSETVKLEVYSNASSSWVTVNTLTGQTTSAAFSFTTAQNTTIFQALNGSATCQSRLTITTYSSSGSSGSVIGSAQVYTGTVTAPAATTAKANSFNIGDTVTITLNPANSAFTHTIKWSWTNNYLGTIGTGITGTSYSWNTLATDTSVTPNDTYANNMYKQIPNQSNDWGTLECTTYYNGVQVRSTVNTANIYGYVVNNTANSPTFSGTGVTYADNASAIVGVTGNNQYIVQNASDLLVSLPTTANATANAYATMSYYIAQCGGVTKQVNYSSSATITFDLGKINLAANDYIYVTAYDSRGFSTQAKIAVNIVPWQAPSVQSKSYRNDGFTDPSTITLTSGTYSQVSIGGTAKNDIVSVNYQYAVKATPQTYPSSGAGSLTAFPSMTHSGGTFSAPNLAVTLSAGSAWTTEVQILDKIMQALGQSPAVIDNVVAVGTPLIFFDTAKNSVGVGQFPNNNNTLEVTGDVWVNQYPLIQTMTATLTGPGTGTWYRIAQTDTSESSALGEFDINGEVPSYHNYSKILAGLDYGAEPFINVLGHTDFTPAGGGSNGPVFSAARIVYNTSYSGNTAYLEVYLSTPSTGSIAITIKLLGGKGWTLLNPTTLGSKPAGFTSIQTNFYQGGGVLQVEGQDGGAYNGTTYEDLNNMRGQFRVVRPQGHSANVPVVGGTTYSYAATLNIPVSSTSDFQLASRYDGTNGLFFRGSHDVGAVWNAWEQIDTIVDQGSNSNGQYYKFASGMMICVMHYAAWSISMTTSGSYYYHSWTWTFPATFSTTTNLAAFNSGDISATGVESHACFNIGTGSCTIEDGIYAPSTTSGLTCTNSLIAIGRWR